MKEGNQEITFSNPLTQLEVLCELLVDFDNLKANGFDLIDEVKLKTRKGSFIV